MGTRRCFPGVVAYSGWLYVAGGTDGVRVLNSVERYHPHSAKWSPVAPMVDNRQVSYLQIFYAWYFYNSIRS